MSANIGSLGEIGVSSGHVCFAAEGGRHPPGMPLRTRSTSVLEAVTRDWSDGGNNTVIDKRVRAMFLVGRTAFAPGCRS